VSVSLDVERQRSPHVCIPALVHACVTYISLHGPLSEGTFRISGRQSRINELERRLGNVKGFENVEGIWEEVTIHDVATVLRRYLNQMPEPVCTLTLYDAFFMLSESVSEETMSSPEVLLHQQRLIYLLPLPHQHLLVYLLQFLLRFALNVSMTKMTISNLASMFQPAILSHPKDAMRVEIYERCRRVLVGLIMNAERLYVERGGQKWLGEMEEEEEWENEEGRALGRSKTHVRRSQQQVRKVGTLGRMLSLMGSGSGR